MLLDYIYVDGPEPHVQRGQEILAAHPEIGKLLGPYWPTGLFVFLLVGFQIFLAYAVSLGSWWWVFPAAYLVGTVVCHALWVLIHDCTHNLVFKTPLPNKFLQIFANLPHILPSAMSFRKYHLRHHRYQGDPQLDADLASRFEARLAGRSALGKAFWLLFFFAFQSTRVGRLNQIKFLDPWTLLNMLVAFSFDAAVVLIFGWKALVFLFLSSIFSVGLHPLGARWIQEHFVVHPGQETFSYYGPLNKLAFNVGYHNEHHDFMRVCWKQLPQIRAMAPEFYNNLYYHTSWTKLLMRFLWDPKITLYSRAVRVKN